MKRPGHENFNAVSHKRARPEVLFSNLKHGSRSGGSRRFYWNFYSLHSVTGNVGDTENDLFPFWQWNTAGVKELDALGRWC